MWRKISRMDWEEILNVAVTIAREAGDLLLEGYHAPVKFHSKSNAVDLVTETDQKAEALITGRLRNAFPDHRLVGEEGTQVDGDSGLVWYIDPIDGTNNFAHKIPFFVVSMALYEGDQPKVAVIFQPITGDLYTAIHGRGATWTRKNGDSVRMQVSGATELVQALLGTGFPYDRLTSDVDNLKQLGRFAKRVQGIRRFGAAALDLAMVAAGLLDGYWEFKLKIWDVAAGVLLITEAGGMVSHIGSTETGFLPADVVHIFVSPPGIHDAMRDLLID